MHKTKLSVELLTVETFTITHEAAPLNAGTDGTSEEWFCVPDSETCCC